MKGWVVPAPAPWAKTKHARACEGRFRSAENWPAFALSMLSCCGLTAFISSARARELQGELIARARQVQGRGLGGSRAADGVDDDPAQRRYRAGDIGREA